MSLSAAVIDALVATGATVEQLAAAMKADLVEGEARAAEKRSKDAARQRKSRMSRDVTVTPCDTVDTPPLDKEKGTQKEINPPRTHTHVTRTREAQLWDCPEGVDPAHWRDFMKARKRKRCVETETAHAGVMNDLARLADEEWPPGRLVEHAAAKGWASINYPTEGSNHETDRKRSYQDHGIRGKRPDPAFDLYVASTNALASAGTGSGAATDFESGVPLPSYLTDGPRIPRSAAGASSGRSS
jgi:hypothetical protein